MALIDRRGYDFSVDSKSQATCRSSSDGEWVMAADTVIGVFHRDHLSSALALLHRGGHGANTRVVDGARGDVVGQLRRAGVANPPTVTDQSAPLVMVFAPGRVAAVVDLLQRTGARAIHLTERTVDPFTAVSLGVSVSQLTRQTRPTVTPDLPSATDQA